MAERETERETERTVKKRAESDPAYHMHQMRYGKRIMKRFQSRQRNLRHMKED